MDKPLEAQLKVNTDIAVNEDKTLVDNSTYDRLRVIVELIIPALAVFILSLGGIWKVDYAEPVAGTVVALGLFLGVLIKLADRSYYSSDKRFDGTVVTQINPDNHSVSYSMEIPYKVFEDLPERDELVLKIS